ncbi:DUF7350 domain-containing protein [Halorhabdus amylolytica]|uniref:DUF7350 domain-containing protein n=1 Tax=Halorhabdus amylolytica TaxID=2559573 RepID=UPI0010AAB767|nr:hypothetical protein [Halorhabdus amylolytica]
MFRRQFLAGGSAIGAATIAGCGSLESRAIDVPPVLDDPPDAIYVPGHVEGMDLVGTETTGEYTVGLSYSYPHRFWTITGNERERTSIDETDSVHLMATVWDPETGLVLPDVGVSIEITQDGSLVSQETVYAMLSQPMGVHHGGNFTGLSDGETYAVRVAVGATASRPTGTFTGRFDEPATATFEFTFETSAMQAIRFERLDRAGERDALEGMSMDAVPTGVALAPEAIPGRTATTMADDIRYVASLVDPPAGVDGQESYLAVSPRTRYNGYSLSRMGLSATLEDDETVTDGQLTRTIDPDLGYHYGTTVPAVDSAELSITVDTPPQVARHEGYETAFFDVPTAKLSL